jgi:hypothetical protein
MEVNLYFIGPSEREISLRSFDDFYRYDDIYLEMS